MIGKLSLAAFLAIAPAAIAQSWVGRWDAVVNVSGVEVPFRFELSGESGNVQGTFFNGEERLPSSSGRFENGTFSVHWDYLASELDATLKDGVLEGKYDQQRRAERAVYSFHAKRFQPAPGDSKAPSIAGEWVIPNKSPKGESAWRFIVHQTGGDVSASILRIDGDTGALTGTYRNGKFVLSHFSGFRPMLLEVSVKPDGSLEMLENTKTKLTAVRSELAKSEGLPQPTDPLHHTSVRNSAEPFQFRFPDLDGHMVSNTDARFRGKVVLVEISGSWCPNCHDEAPFLVSLYRKYHEQGLEIVTLSFEEADQLKNPERLRAFIERYKIDYNVLLCGEPDEAASKLPQAVNWNSWPTTFFVDRSGLVANVHAGFPSSASGDLFRQAKDDFTARVEGLLAQPAHSPR